MATLNFTVDSALLNELGEKLVETVHIALVELVKNSYDADAKNVTVRFVENANGVSELHVIDDGTGMNFKDVESYWMRIATINKSIKDRSPKYGRPRTGSKGIGRFSCRRLGRELTLITTGIKNKSYQKTEVVFPWKKFKAGIDVTQIKCHGKRYISNKGATGTKLIISDLVDEWNERGYGYLKRQLAILVANQGARRDGYEDDPGFNIILEAPQFEGGLRNLREDLINAGWGTITAHINKKHQAVCELNALGVGRKTITSSQKYQHLNDVSLKIGILVDERAQLRDTTVVSKGGLSKMLPEWGGVQIKFKGFRVYPYGDDDWLDIDHDRALRKGSSLNNELTAFARSLRRVDPKRALLSMISMKSHVGHVEIGLHAQGFEMKANREGFVKSPAIDELKLFTRYCIDWATIYRDYYLRKKAKYDVEVAREYLQEVTNKKIEPDKIVKSAVDYLKKEVKSISTILPAKERRSFQDSFHEATDAILKHDVSNKEELRHLRVIASTSTLMLIFSHEVKSLLGTLETNESSLAIIEKKLAGEDRELVKEIREGLKESKTRFEDLLGLTSMIADSKKAVPGQLALHERLVKAEKAYQLIVKAYNIEINYKEVPNNIMIGSILEAELYAILLNILSNSIKSVIAAGGEKEIKITAAREGGKTIIKIMDTGLGLDPSRYEDVFIPFIADPDGKLYKNLERRLNPEDKYIVGTGSGLGLSIVKEIVQVRSGTIAFNRPSGKWSTELEISLP